MVKKKEVSFNVMDTIGKVADKLKNSKCKPRKTKEFLANVERLCSYFATTEHETWMLCAIISYYYENHGGHSSFTNLAEFFGFSVLSVHAYRKEIESLIGKSFIHNDMSIGGKNICLKNKFVLSTELLECLLANRKIVLTTSKKENNISELMKKIGKMIEDDAFSYSEKRSQTKEMEEKYSSNEFFVNVLRLIPDDTLMRLFFYGSCGDFLNGYETGLLETINGIYPEPMTFIIGKAFMDGSNVLLKNDLLEFTTRGTLADSKLELTSKAKEMLLGDDAWLFMKSAKGTDVIQPEDITPIKLFYSAENELEIGRLKASLNEEKLRDIQERLAAKGLSKGIAVLLYGAPGTGKTETVYQLARETHRAILHVDISSAKSCWFGESEKIVKRIFIDYKQMCRSSRGNKDGIMPILLFNEADGILSKRKDVTNGNLSQTENTIQNIILEEIEKLEGIMICTTNLANNLDAAFERRFLFKIKFEYPTVDAKKRIWKSKLGWLDDDVAVAVAKDYNLSGGQIDNIVRKITMAEVLTGKLPDMDELFTMCRNEKLGGTEHTIGFF